MKTLRTTKSMNPVTKFLLAIIALSSWLVAGPAWSAIATVTVAPTSASIPLGQPTSVTLVWTVTRSAGGLVGTVSSSQGQFVVPGAGAAAVLATANNALYQANVPDGVPATLVESVLVPQDVAQRAMKLGVSNLLYQRTFADSLGGGTQMASITLNISSAGASGFGVTRMALSFDNGAPLRLLSRREPLSAQAEINFIGTGLLQGEWQVAGPPSTSSEPFYRTLSQVRQYFAGGAGQVLKSPALPTAGAGLHYVRFRISDPIPGFEAPVIRYFVGESGAGKDLPAEALVVTDPPPFALLADGTAFSWEAIKGARAYQVELYAADRSAAGALPDPGGGDPAPNPTDVSSALTHPPVAGMLVPGKLTSTTLSSATRQHLLPGYRYYWRVKAIGGDGSIIGMSPVRELSVP